MEQGDARPRPGIKGCRSSCQPPSSLGTSEQGSACAYGGTALLAKATAVLQGSRCHAFVLKQAPRARAHPESHCPSEGYHCYRAGGGHTTFLPRGPGSG